MSDKLTPKQLSRVQSRLEGKSIRAIAREQGVSAPAVHESLRSPAVRAAFERFSETTRVALNGAEPLPVVDVLLERVSQIALSGMRTVVVGNKTERVPDDRLRAETGLRLLDLLVRMPAPAPKPEPEPRVAIELEETVERTAKRTRRLHVRAPGAAAVP